MSSSNLRWNSLFDKYLLKLPLFGGQTKQTRLASNYTQLYDNHMVVFTINFASSVGAYHDDDDDDDDESRHDFQSTQLEPNDASQSRQMALPGQTFCSILDMPMFYWTMKNPMKLSAL